MNTTFDVAGFTISVASIITIAAIVQFAFIALTSMLSKERLPNKGMRSAERRVIISAVICAVATGAVFALQNPLQTKHAEASVVTTNASPASCSSIETGMTDAVVKQKLSAPDEIRSDEETRGPGAKIWIYRASRCSVHMLDDRVEFID